MKLSYSCNCSISSTISSHNGELLQEKQTPAIPPTLSNCRKNTICPLNGECCSKCLAHKADLTSDNLNKYYYGLCETTLKTRYNNHKHTFKHQEKRHSRELPKAYWNSTKTGKHPNIKRNIEKRASPIRTALTDVTFV